MMQRIFDIIISGLALLFLSPILIPLAVLLRFTGEKEVFYRQTRVGQNGQHFGLLKFATMLKNSPSIGAGEITLRNDQRILPLGRFLRKTKLNEIPQLWNVLIGDMSIVGPRPMVPSTFANYPEQAKIVLNTVKPGLTGIGSIIFRDEERFLDNRTNPIEFYYQEIIPYKSSLELWFVQNISIATYFKIIFITAWVIIFPASNIPRVAFQGLPVPPKWMIT